MELVKDSTIRLNHCEYSLVWTARPIQSGKKNHQLPNIAKRQEYADAYARWKHRLEKSMGGNV